MKIHTKNVWKSPDIFNLYPVPLQVLHVLEAEV